MRDGDLGALIDVRHCETFEVGVLEGLDGRDSFLGVEDHHFVHQIDGVLARIRYQLVERCGDELGESEANLGRKLVPFGPLGLCWAAQDSARFVNLVRLVVAREKGTHQV